MQTTTITQPMDISDTYAILAECASQPTILATLVKAEKSGIGRIGGITVIHVGYTTDAFNLGKWEASTSLYQIQF